MSNEAIRKLRRAIEDEGRSPQHHRAVMAQHRHEWPTLWRAIDELLAEGSDQDG